MTRRKGLLERLHAISDRDAMEWPAYAAAALAVFCWNGWNLAQHLVHGRIYVLDSRNPHWAYWSQEPRADAVFIALACVAIGGLGLATLATMAVLRLTRGPPPKPHEALAPANLDRV